MKPWVISLLVADLLSGLLQFWCFFLRGFVFRTFAVLGILGNPFLGVEMGVGGGVWGIGGGELGVILLFF